MDRGIHNAICSSETIPVTFLFRCNFTSSVFGITISTKIMCFYFDSRFLSTKPTNPPLQSLSILMFTTNLYRHKTLLSLIIFSTFSKLHSIIVVKCLHSPTYCAPTPIHFLHLLILWQPSLIGEREKRFFLLLFGQKPFVSFMLCL